MKKIAWKKLNVDEVASIIYSSLKEKGMEATLSGGACVSIYSNNRYKSADLDFVMPEYERGEVDAALKELGFERTKSWRHYENPSCPWMVEFPPPPLAVGEEVISKTKIIKTKHGNLRLLRPVDCVKDRLAAFYHWGDRQSLNQAVMVAKDNRVSLKELKRWSENEMSLDKFEIFKNLLKKK